MTLNEIIYIAAYCMFLAGASKSFRENGSRASVWIMTAGVALDFLVSMLPVVGVKAFKMDVTGTNPVIISAIALGFVVWLLFAAALILRHKRKTDAYHALITITEIAWFVDFIAFLYGMYAVPLQ